MSAAVCYGPKLEGMEPRAISFQKQKEIILGGNQNLAANAALSTEDLQKQIDAMPSVTETMQKECE